MKVKTISRTMSFGNYENISMSADVEDGETVGEALGKLEAVINEEIKKRNNYHLEKSCVDNLEYRKSQLKKDIEHLENRYNKMKKFLEIHGVRIDEITELPFKPDTGGVKMTTIVQEIKDIIEDARQIESATGYGPDYLYHHNCCDSSVRRSKRMAFVKQAEAEFIEANKKEILKNAAKLCRESIGDISELITLGYIK